MKITPMCDSYRDDDHNSKYISKVNDVINKLKELGLLEEDLTIIGSHKKILKHFFKSKLGVYIDGVGYCAKCHSELTNVFHCHMCNMCKPASEFDDECILKLCKDCTLSVHDQCAPSRGYSMIGGYMSGTTYIFKTNA